MVFRFKVITKTSVIQICWTADFVPLNSRTVSGRRWVIFLETRLMQPKMLLVKILGSIRGRTENWLTILMV